ncbi:MAG: cyclic nucleotide-binding domain-containing protein [Chlamydiota bacterium]|nr:cyclic nucleotide-binding domain-containing protein [Chlamydiota bacterium]
MKQLSLLEAAYHLKKTPIFCSLELDLLLPIADKMIYTEIDAEEIIFDIGQQAYNLYLLTEGSLTVTNVDEIELAKLQQGEVFGEEAIFSEKTREYRVTTNTAAKLLYLSRADLLAIIYEYPSVATGFLEVYASATPFRPR